MDFLFLNLKKSTYSSKPLIHTFEHNKVIHNYGYVDECLEYKL